MRFIFKKEIIIELQTSDRKSCQVLRDMYHGDLLLWSVTCNVTDHNNAQQCLSVPPKPISTFSQLFLLKPPCLPVYTLFDLRVRIWCRGEAHVPNISSHACRSRTTGFVSNLFKTSVSVGLTYLLPINSRHGHQSLQK